MAILWFKLRLIYSTNHRVIDLLNDLNKTKTPIVSEDIKEQIGRIFIHSIQTHEEKSISYIQCFMIV